MSSNKNFKLGQETHLKNVFQRKRQRNVVTWGKSQRRAINVGDVKGSKANGRSCQIRQALHRRQLNRRVTPISSWQTSKFEQFHCKTLYDFRLFLAPNYRITISAICYQTHLKRDKLVVDVWRINCSHDVPTQRRTKVFLQGKIAIVG